MREWFNSLFSEFPKKIAIIKEDNDNDDIPEWRFGIGVELARGMKMDTVMRSSIEDTYSKPDDAIKVIREFGFKGEIRVVGRDGEVFHVVR